MKVFVTGGSGFIGSQLVASLLQQGHEVVGLVNKTQPAQMHPNLRWVKGSLLQVESLVEAMRGCSQVYHVGGVVGMWHPKPDAFFDYNTKGTENMLTAAKNVGISKFVFTSTGAVISHSLHTPMHEDDPLLHPFEDDYAASKYLAEGLVIKAASEGLPAVIVNPPRVYGPAVESAWVNPLNKLIVHYLKSSYYLVPANGKAFGNYAFIDDVVQGHLLAMEHGQSGQRFILGGENVDYLQFYGMVHQLSGIKRRAIHVPKTAINLVANIAEAYSSISGKQPFITKAVANKFFANRMISSEKAVRELGYQITPLKAGLEKTITFLKTKLAI